MRAVLKDRVSGMILMHVYWLTCVKLQQPELGVVW